MWLLRHTGAQLVLLQHWLRMVFLSQGKSVTNASRNPNMGSALNLAGLWELQSFTVCLLLCPWCLSWHQSRFREKVICTPLMALV